MPFFIAIVGIVLLVSALRGQVGTLFGLIKSDFTGSGNFLYWVVALLAVGSIGYVKKLQPISDAFLALILVVFTLSNKGFFNQFMQGLSATGNCPASSDSSTNQPTVTGPSINLLPGINVPSNDILGTNELMTNLNNLTGGLKLPNYTPGIGNNYGVTP